nr:putative ribonuclease H-like domain-containing protein [Tanacetum cinerariifolium]
MTLVEAAKTMLADSLLPIPFWAEAVNTAWSGRTWLFDIDTLTLSMNYRPVVAGNQPNSSADPYNLDADADAAFADKENESEVHVSPSSGDKTKKHDEKAKREAKGKSDEEDVSAEADFSNLETSINGHTQEEGIDYEEVFAPVARIESIWLFLAYASLMGFMVYQMDVKSDFLYGTIEEEVYVCQPLGFEDPCYLDKVYNVVKALYGLHQAPRA